MPSGAKPMLLVAQRISTGSGGDCEIPFFPDDSDVRATEPWPVRCSERWRGIDRPRSRSRNEVGGVLIMSRRTDVARFRPSSMEWKKRQRRFD